MKRETRYLPAVLASLLVALALALPVSDARAAEPASAPAGFYKVDCLGNSDTIVSIPFTRPEAAFALVDSVAGDVVTVQGTPGWIEGQFVYNPDALPVAQSNTYYLRFLSGAKEGSYYPILANDATSLTINLSGDDIFSVASGDRLAVIPYWTLATAFPDGKGVIASTNIIFRHTEVYIPDVSGVGINLSPGFPYYFLKPEGSTGNWRRFNSDTVRDDDILLPDVYFIVRHNSSTGTVFTAQGSVPTSKLTIPLVSQTEPTSQDNFVALTRPTAITLDESGLVESGAFLVTTDPVFRADELYLFNNSLVAHNKSPGLPYYYYDNAWRRVGTPLTTDVGGLAVLTPGTGVIIRKKPTPGGFSSFWTNSPSY